MKFLFDLFPVILFFITLKFAEKSQAAGMLLSKILGMLGITATVKPDLVPIMLATAVVILATFLQVAWVKFRHGKVDKMLWLSLMLIVLFGGMTLYFQNSAFIKWKPTVLYWLFAISLVVSNAFFGKNLIRGLMDKQISMPDNIWNKLNLAWALFFAVLGAINLYVAFNFSIDTWANYKLFGTSGLMLLFFIGQALLLDKHMTAKDAE